MSLHPDIAAVLAGERRWCVVEADCLDVLPTLPDRSVAHVITDPPYLGARGESWESDSVPLVVPYEPASPELLRSLAEQALRAAETWVLVFNDYPGQSLLREALSTSADHVVSPQPVPWVKPPGAFTPNGTAYSPAKQVDFITAARRRRVRKLRPLPGAYVSQPYSPNVEILRTGGKPVSLMRDIVADFTDPDDIILDPFAGSGTTGVAALRLGRRAILIEREPKYAAIARERLQAEDRGSTLQAQRAGQVSIFDAMGASK